METIHITMENYKSEIQQSDKPVLIDFCATWCGPCQTISPVIEALAEEVEDAKICKVNVDEQPELARQYTVMSVPTLVVIKGGRVVDKAIGVQSKDEIMNMLLA